MINCVHKDTAVKILQTRIKIAVPAPPPPQLPVGLDIFAQLRCSEPFPRPCTGEERGRDGGGEVSYGRGLETNLSGRAQKRLREGGPMAEGWKQTSVSNSAI